MKYAFMSFSTTEMTLGQMLAAAKKYGYDGIEPRIDCEHKHGVEWSATAAARKESRAKAAGSGIEICCIATSCDYSDPATWKQNIDDTRRSMDLAADVVSPRIRVFGGTLSDDLSRNAAIAQVSDALRSLTDHAQQRGVTICLETHDSWTHPEHVAAVMKRVNHPAVAVNWDYWHPVRYSGIAIESAFETLKPWIRHVHFHDANVRLDKPALRPMGTGDLDCRLAVKLLQDIQYTGYLSGEWIRWEAPEVHLPREVAQMRKYERE
jgi:sugar phosphate isomerase/epimerase